VDPAVSPQRVLPRQADDKAGDARAIDVAVTAGKILYVGSSNFAGWHIAEAQEAAQGSGAGRTLRAVSATRPGPHAPDSDGVDGQPAHLRGLAD
jgi:aryl-alcohol dehydrogenase-like predicted oxidoreductase